MDQKSRSGRRLGKKRKAWNKGKTIQENHQQEDNQEEDNHQEIPSTSRNKLENSQEYPTTEFKGYRLFNLELLMRNIADTVGCKNCGGPILFQEDSLTGLGGEYSFQCQKCAIYKSFSSCEKIGQRGTSYEINQRSILAMRMIGNGRAGLETFCGIMELAPPLQLNSFNRNQDKILEATTFEAEGSMSRAVKQEIMKSQEIQEDHQEGTAGNSSREAEEDQNAGPKKIRVKGDGTWQKVGYTSLNGAVSIIGAESEKVIDQEVLTIYCKICNKWKKTNGSPSGENWENWYRNHQPNCARNYSGSSGGMESIGMVRCFKRSVLKHNVQYTEYIGDGDSKTFYNIQKAEPYGPDVVIKKLECVGHVGKRFGYHMRKLKTTLKGKKLSDGKGMFGKGRLTDGWIVKMQTYYAGAIRNNPTSLSNMIRDCFSIKCMV